MRFVVRFVASIVAVAMVLPLTACASLLVAGWTFDPAPATATAGPRPADLGANAGAGSPALAFHASTSTYANVAGNGTVNSFSSNTWAIGDYYQFSTSTTGYDTLSFTFAQTSSNTGPRDFEIRYSTDGTSFTNLLSYSVLANGASPNASWNSTTASSAYVTTVELPPSLHNQPLIYLRLVDVSTVSANGGTVAGTGTNRVDTVSIQAFVPEPSAFLFGTIVCGLIGLRATQRDRRNQQV